jgi:hypothetical protein
MGARRFSTLWNPRGYRVIRENRHRRPFFFCGEEFEEKSEENRWDFF